VQKTREEFKGNEEEKRIELEKQKAKEKREKSS